MKARKKSAARTVLPKPSAAFPPLPTWKRWTFRVLAASLPVPALLLCLEGALRLGGYGYDTRLVVKDAGGQYFHENDKFLWQFHGPKTKLQPHPFLVSVQKDPNAVRIVVLGESAALGTPEPSYGFWRMLDRQLRHDFPGRKIEVINAAMRGINSHIILPVARECAKLQPDLFVIYAGNNEVVGLHAPDKNSRLTSLTFFRAVDWCKGTRVGQLLWGFAPDKKENPQDMEFFRAHRVAADDPRRQAIYRNFETNLRDIYRASTNCGARVVLSTVAVNLKDCPPLASLHRPGFSGEDQAFCDGALAASNTNDPVKQLEAVVARDDHFAEWHFRLAELLANDPARRLHEYQLARDWDALQFRADQPVNDAIRRVASELGIKLVEAEKAFTSPEHIPGQDIFYEHVHLRFDGDYLLAKNLYPAIVSQLGLPAPEGRSFASREEFARWLSYTSVNEFQIEYSIIQLLGTPPFLDQYQHAARLSASSQSFTNKFLMRTTADVKKDIDSYLAAIREATNDWHLYQNLGDLYMTVQKPPPAVEEYLMASRLMPHYKPCRLKLARAQARAGRPDKALETLEQGLKLDPKSPVLKSALAQTQNH